jgi:hypothetical protein
MGIPANVQVSRLPPAQPMWTFDGPDEAVAIIREHLILAPDPVRDADLRGQLAAGLFGVDGRVTVPGPERAVACIWWDRDGPRRPPL